MKNQSLINLLNKIIQDSGVHKKMNTLIYSNDKEIDFKKVRKIITGSNKKIIKNDILTKVYFHKKLSLLQNIKFHTAHFNIDMEQFLNRFALKEHFEQLKHNYFEEIGPNIWNQYEALLYIYTNKNLLVEKNNFFSELDIITDGITSLLEDKEIFFLTSKTAKQLQQIRQYFDVFIKISDNNIIVFKNFETFSNAITE